MHHLFAHRGLVRGKPGVPYRDLGTERWVSASCLCLTRALLQGAPMASSLGSLGLGPSHHLPVEPMLSEALPFLALPRTPWQMLSVPGCLLSSPEGRVAVKGHFCWSPLLWHSDCWEAFRAGRALAMGHCRLCHGKFSSRSLRSISDRASGDSAERPFPGERVFVRDFQRLLGVAVHQDPALSQFVCRNCHAQFYQCHSLLESFLQRVNVSPMGQRKPCAKVSGKKSESKEAKKTEEPKIRKKPGPKPGWKKQLRSEREELPTIYKCPYQGCTAVYRGADGMKKHIKEHHEEVRERPCPHPGCNKVFMIDRYLQRHVKLIHTEVRNYICDECGQTFKQRKHLLVHQMRHSGAKPLQCEVCGFQCRQRASLKYHMTKHKAETELDFACDQCGRRFEKAHNLNVHMSMVHPLTQTQDKALPLEAEPPPGPPHPSGTTEGQAVKPEPT
uniref:Zinc finger protein 276 n=1 Tax=Oryctolagus cuniculus TaxID=9986 RepID=A0A5F9DVY6_RABIT